jgi:hypothetical protein
MRTVIRHLVAGASAVIIFPALCFAQFGAIAGVVKDDTGAVLPGVTVEAASPALIEKTRTAISDSAGQYNVEQLRPGVYTVTFTLTGFSTVRREGIEISAGFTAPVNASLKVGAVAETITVTGEAPVVDVQSISQQRTLPKEALDALPTSRSFETLGTTIPGVTASQRDVGGSVGERGNLLSAHGGAPFDMTLQIDGLDIGIVNAHVAFTVFSMNDAAAKEVVFETDAISAETASGGVRVNVIPREGGNTFSGSVFGNGATGGMALSNYTADLQARGLKTPAGFVKLWDESAGVGGPLRRDRVWFFYAQRYRGNDAIGPNAFYSKDPLAFVYTPDVSRPLHYGGWDSDNQLRVTSQLTRRNKVSVFVDKTSKCNCPVTQASPTTTGEASNSLIYPELHLLALSWQSTISSRLLWDAAVSYNRQDTANVPLGAGITQTGPVSLLELSTGVRWGAPFTDSSTPAHNYYSRGALSYDTGSHAAKLGFTLRTGNRTQNTNPLSDFWTYSLLNGIPQSVTLTAAPYVVSQNINADLGVYAQDRWTLRRLTLTGGVRFDYFNNSVPALSAAAGRWVGARSFPAIDDVPNWKDISPRFGASYDLFGNGKTAIKGSVSRYVSTQVFGFAQTINPFTTSVNTATRTWHDTNGDGIPEGDPLNPLPNGEFLGTINPNFGKSFITTTYDPAVSQGWGKRPYDWEYAASVQHELLPRVSLEAGYYRRTYSNFTVTDNLDVTPADFTPFCISAPTDPRLGSISGSQICGLDDISPAKAGLASHQLITFASHYPGETSQTYTGVDVNVNARPTGRLFLQAGFSTGRTDTKNCSLVDDPMSLRFCEVKPPFLWNYRVSGGYTFPWQLQVSGVFQSIPADPSIPGSGGTGQTALATYNVTNAVASASLGRPIATPGGVIAIPLIGMSNYPDYIARVNQLDLRLSKGVRVGRRYRVEAIADFYNIFNSSTILSYNAQVGPAWLTPVTILQSGFVKLGGRVTF